MNSVVEEQGDPPLRYARFSRRLRAIVIDWIVMVAVIISALLLSASMRSDTFSRTIGFSAMLVLLLYEPVLVSRYGGTVGHHLSNLRVVDDRTGGNISFVKAVARLFIKGLLGWYSFLMITATRRNQALHDVLTRSTVQIRDPAKASLHHYIVERAALDTTKMPSRLRRVLVILIYCVLIMVAEVLVFAAFMIGGLLSPACVNRQICTAGEALGSQLLNITVVLALIATAVVIGMGWRGRLFGAQKKI